jgi:2-haloacid dehalogenase
MTIKALVFDAYGTLYDVQSVAGATEAAFPGHGEFITQVWRLKQLEYTWLRSLMGRYEDFGTVTRESLAYTLAALGLSADGALFDRLVQSYDRLVPYPDAAAALDALGDFRLAILSNGSAEMLDALTRHSGLAGRFEAVLSVDSKRAYKPDPRAYELVEERLGVRPNEVVFVSSNGFDVSGAKSFGFRVARIERVTAAALKGDLGGPGAIGPAAMFRALRMRPETLGYPPDATIASLTELAGLARAFAEAPGG